MTGATDSMPLLTGQDRRRVATRPLADASGIGRGTVRRPASALTGDHRDRLVTPAV